MNEDSSIEIIIEATIPGKLDWDSAKALYDLIIKKNERLLWKPQSNFFQRYFIEEEELSIFLQGAVIKDGHAVPFERIEMNQSTMTPEGHGTEFNAVYYKITIKSNFAEPVFAKENLKAILAVQETIEKHYATE